mgnify:CR=1 FL=1
MLADAPGVRFRAEAEIGGELEGEPDAGGYRLTMPVERTVNLVQDWEKEKETGAWQVRLQLAELREGLGVAE